MKYLVTGDNHIGQYRNYNITPNGRLYQFLDIAGLLVERAQELGINKLILAGDTLNIPINPSHVNKVVDNYFKILLTHFEDIYVIYGQHDMVTKSSEQIESDSDLSRIFRWSDRVHYMNKKFLKDSDHTIYFQNWTKEQDISHLEEQVDLMIGHLTIPFGVVRGQTIDNSKFKLGIFGDIHKQIQVGNLVSTGCLTQIKSDEQLDGTFITYDTETRTHEVHLLDPERKVVPRLVITKYPELAGPNVEENTYYIYRPDSVRVESQDIELPDWAKIEELVQEVMRSHEILDLHNLIKSKVDYRPINFDFQLNWMKIRNIRSIKELDYYFNDHVLITGLNGSGKSTFMNCIPLGLIGSRRLRHDITRGENHGSIEINLTYENKTYTIHRSSGADWFEIEGDRRFEGNKSDVQEAIMKELLFLPYLDSIVFDANRGTILGSMNSDRRIEILSKHYRLDILDEYSRVAYGELHQLKTELVPLETKLQDLISKMELLQEERSSKEDDILPSEVVTQYNTRLEEIKGIIARISSINKAYNELTNKKSALNQLMTTLDSKRTELSILSEPSEDEISELRRCIEVIDDKLNEHKGIKDKIRELKARELVLVNSIEPLVEANKILSSSKCTECNQVIDKEEAERKIHDNVSRIESINTSVDIIDNDISELSTKLASISVEELGDERSVHSNKLTELNTLKTKYNIITEEVSRLSNQETKLMIEVEDANTNLTEVLSGKSYDEYSSIDVSILNSESNDITTKLNKHKAIKDLLLRITDYEIEIEEVTKEKDILLPKIIEIETYIELLKRNGVIYTEVLNRLTEKFSNENFIFKTVSYRQNGNPYSDLSVLYKVGDEFLPYESLSSGQKTLCDVYFLFRVILNSGMILFDEFFKHMDVHNTNAVVDLLSIMKVRNLIISSHEKNLVMDASNLYFHLNDDGTSEAIRS